VYLFPLQQLLFSLLSSPALTLRSLLRPRIQAWDLCCCVLAHLQRPAYLAICAGSHLNSHNAPSVASAFFEAAHGQVSKQKDTPWHPLSLESAVSMDLFFVPFFFSVVSPPFVLS